jgi:benzil reductase ((S)-benzoin forming)
MHECNFLSTQRRSKPQGGKQRQRDSFSKSKKNIMAIALVTGARSGIGMAIADRIATFPHVDRVLAVARHITPSSSWPTSSSSSAEDVTTAQPSSKLTAVAADVTTAAGRHVIVEAVRRYCCSSDSSDHIDSSTSSSCTAGIGAGAGQQPQQPQQPQRQQLLYLVHCAGTIEPIKSVLDVTADDLRTAMVLNCEAPLLLTTALYPYLSSIIISSTSASASSSSSSGTMTVAGRVLHVSSGAAHGAPPVGWSVYGLSKAAFFQSYKVLEREFREHKNVDGRRRVVVGSFKPGVVDTAMQRTIRGTADTVMPTVDKFRALFFEQKNDHEMNVMGEFVPRPPPPGVLDSPLNVACFADWLLRGTSDEEFANKDSAHDEYDIRDETLFPKWIPNYSNKPPSL